MIYVIGAGLAGLSAGVALTSRGFPVRVIEAAGGAGGRCRSFYDPQLGMMVDNGNHLILSGNVSVHRYLKTIGATRSFVGPREAEFAFYEKPSAMRWTVAPNRGLLPWWIFNRRRRVPDTQARDYVSFVPLVGSGNRTAAELKKREDVLWRRMLRPVLLATLNTDPEEASGNLIAAILLGTLGRGGRACRPRVAWPTLGEAFIDPAVAFICDHGGEIEFGRRLIRLSFDGGRVSELEFPDRRQKVEAGDCVILAVPAWSAKALVQGLSAPDDHHAIISVHFAIEPPAGTPTMTGLIDATAEWVFSFPDRLSATISNADRLLETSREDIAAACWNDISEALRLPAKMPPWQVIKEKRATFAATPQQERKRSGPTTAWQNLFMAGDWTATGLPATIEGAVRSGRRAAKLARRSHAA